MRHNLQYVFTVSFKIESPFGPLHISINPKMTQTLSEQSETVPTPPVKVYIAPELDLRMQNPDNSPARIHIVPCDLTVEGVHFTVQAIELVEEVPSP
jgi:hypothetical protein